MKILDFAKIMLLCVITMGMASCGDDIYYTTIQNSDEKLCGKNWVDENRFDVQSISIFAKKIDRDPGIVLGRLLNDGKVAYNDWTLTSLRHKYRVKTS